MATTPHTPEKTPMKCLNFLSPSGNNICFICQSNAKEKINIWKQGMDCCLTTHGEKLQSVFSIKISKKNDFPCICRNCWRKIQRHADKHDQFLETTKCSINRGREIAKSSYMRQRFKRGKKLDESKSRKKLNYNNNNTDMGIAVESPEDAISNNHVSTVIY